MNSAVNPVLYGVLNPKLRSHYYGILTCKDKNKVAWVNYNFLVINGMF